MRRSAIILPVAVLSFAVLIFTFCSKAGDNEAVLMKIESIRGNLESGVMIVILMEAEGARVLPISVGGDQALAIHFGQHGLTAPRPLTHDLMAQILSTMHASVERVTITDLREGTYFAELALRHQNEKYNIDARPSDAIALSLRVNSPIYAMPHLLAKGIDLDVTNGGVPPYAETPVWGLAVQPLSPEIAEFFDHKEGVLVSDVSSGGPAEKSGVMPGDIIVRIQESPIKDLRSFLEKITSQDTTKRVALEIIRGSETRKLVLAK